MSSRRHLDPADRVLLCTRGRAAALGAALRPRGPDVPRVPVLLLVPVPLILVAVAVTVPAFWLSRQADRLDRVRHGLTRPTRATRTARDGQ